MNKTYDFDYIDFQSKIYVYIYIYIYPDYRCINCDSTRKKIKKFEKLEEYKEDFLRSVASDKHNVPPMNYPWTS